MEKKFELRGAWTYLQTNQVFIYDESNNIQANCCTPEMRKICDTDEMCFNYFYSFGRKKLSEEYIVKIFAGKEKKTISEIEELNSEDRQLLREKYQKEAYENCKRIFIDVLSLLEKFSSLGLKEEDLDIDLKEE